MARVAITRDEKIEQAVAEALSHLALEPLVRGKLVAVKPNDTWASAADTSGVTQPDTLRAVLRHLRRFGPRELVVSGGSGAAETDEVFRVAGLMAVISWASGRKGCGTCGRPASWDWGRPMSSASIFPRSA